jgi:hypothetical protein
VHDATRRRLRRLQRRRPVKNAKPTGAQIVRVDVAQLDPC